MSDFDVEGLRLRSKRRLRREGRVGSRLRWIVYLPIYLSLHRLFRNVRALVLGCIEVNFRDQSTVTKLLKRSTSSTFFSNFQKT